MSLKRGIFYTLLTQAPTLVLYFVASTLMTRLLGDEGRGAYALLTNQIALFSILLWFNLSTGITYFISREGGAKKNIIGTATTILLLELLFIPLLLLAIYRTDALRELFMPEMADHWAYYGFVGLSIFTSIYQSAMTGILLGLKHFRVLNTMSILNAVLSAIGFLLLFLILGDTASPDNLPFVLIASTVVLVVISATWTIYYILLVGKPPVPILDPVTLKPILLFSFIGYLSIVINLINYRFDIWVVDRYHGTASLGLYGVAVGLGQLLFNVPEPFSRVVVPFLYGDRTEEMLFRYKAMARMNFTLVLLLAVILGAIASHMVPMLFGEVFASSVPALWLLLPGILFSSATKMMSQLVVQRDLQHFNLYATSAGALITIVLDLLLIPEWGIEGAAIASSLSYLVILMVVSVTIRYRIGVPVHDMFLVRADDLKILTRSIPWRAIR